MPTSFEVIYLGQLSRIDSLTNNEEIAENAGGILGTYGSAGSPLFNNIRNLTADFLLEDDNSSYDVDNIGGYDRFRINGGAAQNFDAVAIYNATITYFDGTTATVTAVVFQDVNGNTYLAPETTNTPDQAALTAAPIRSLHLVSVASNTGDAVGDMAATRIAGDFKAPVDGAETGQTMGVGYADALGDLITGGSDLVVANGGNDTVATGAGNDLVHGGAGADILNGDDGADRLFGEQGSDSLFGGTGEDYISGGTEDDLMYGGADADTLLGDEGDDAMFGDAGNDVGIGGLGLDTLSGGDGNDALWGEAGDDTLTGDAGSDTLYGGDGGDGLSGGTGTDTLTGDSGADTLFGGAEADGLFGGADADILSGDAGNDRLSGGAGDDTATGGAGDDSFFLDRAGGADTVTDFDMTDANGDGRTNDQLDISDLRNPDGSTVTGFDVVVQAAGPGNTRLVFPEGESIVLLGVDPSQMATAAQMFRAGIPCFTPDTLILTPQGQRPVTSLRPGDLVVTRDDGPQPVVWCGRRDLSAADLAAHPHLAPVRIAPGAFGNARTLLVSPQHAVLLRDASQEERLFRAIHLARMAGGAVRVACGVRRVSYVHIMFDRHQVVLSNGIWTESFYPGPQAMACVDAAARTELLTLFPALAQGAAAAIGLPARDIVSGRALPSALRALRPVPSCATCA